ncbi:SsgA family sporulation/cell division regulator [Amycolatopsis sp. NPDC059090]|uniref:SsgA family sporulation/cell division regulator n=1 Tax=unclassified Amycolatopsis TaxID=2618356 RepID=UPI00367326BF
MNDNKELRRIGANASDDAIVTRELVFDLMAGYTHPVPIRAKLRYGTLDPYAVSMEFDTVDAPHSVQWIFARCLLASGLHSPTGTGDVRVRPSEENPEAVLIELDSPTGYAVLCAPVSELREFLDRTYDIVPWGSESRWVDFDLEFARLSAD